MQFVAVIIVADAKYVRTVPEEHRIVAKASVICLAVLAKEGVVVASALGKVQTSLMLQKSSACMI